MKGQGALLKNLRSARRKGAETMTSNAPPVMRGPPATAYPDGARTEPGASGGQKPTADRRIPRIFTIWSAFIMLSLGAVWVFTEYLTHGGWPSGVTLGAGGNGVWNLWIIYPIIAGVLLISLHWTMTYVAKPMRQD